MERKDEALKTGLGAGLLAALVASLCCTGPALLALLGLGGLAGSLALPRYHTAFMILALLVLGGGAWLARRRGTAGSCSAGGSCCHGKGTGWSSTLGLGLAVFVVAYILLSSWGVPALAEQAYGPAQAGAAVAVEGPVRRAELAVEGMTCAACAKGIEATLSRRPGVVAAQVDYDAAALRVRYRPEQDSPAGLVRALAELGYSASLVRDGEGSDD